MNKWTESFLFQLRNKRAFIPCDLKVIKDKPTNTQSIISLYEKINYKKLVGFSIKLRAFFFKKMKLYIYFMWKSFKGKFCNIFWYGYSIIFYLILNVPNSYNRYITKIDMKSNNMAAIQVMTEKLSENVLITKKFLTVIFPVLICLK